jgi:hypothetical protein
LAEGSVGNRLRGLLASDVYTEKGKLRSDDLLVRERVGRGLSEAVARVNVLISEWRADRVPPSTREQPFPPAEVMEPIRKAERLIRAINDASTRVRGLPVISPDRVWNRVRQVGGLEDLIQFDWTLVGESDALANEVGPVFALDELDFAGYEARLKKIRETVSERQRYLEIGA